MAMNEQMKQCFRTDKPIIGMVHLKSLPGTPHYNGSFQEIVDFACTEAETLQQNGIDAIQIENQFDRPYLKPEDIGYETIAYMSTITTLIAADAKVPYGVHVMMNGIEQAIAIAHSTNASWVRVYELANAYIANSGWIEAAGPKALRYRKQLGADSVMLLGDFHVKHGSHFIVNDRPIPELAHDVEAFGAEGLILTGTSTGKAPAVDDAKVLQKHINLPLFIGSGFNYENAESFLPHIDGVIVGSALKVDGVLENQTDGARVRRLMDIVHKFRD